MVVPEWLVKEYYWSYQMKEHVQQSLVNPDLLLELSIMYKCIYCFAISFNLEHITIIIIIYFFFCIKDK